jgi:hypothetical protein
VFHQYAFFVSLGSGALLVLLASTTRAFIAVAVYAASGVGAIWLVTKCGMVWSKAPGSGPYGYHIRQEPRSLALGVGFVLRWSNGLVVS